MFLSECRDFPSAPCLAGKKKTWWQLASRCFWNRARPWHASELVCFLVGLRTYQHPGTIKQCGPNPGYTQNSCRVLTYTIPLVRKSTGLWGHRYFRSCRCTVDPLIGHTGRNFQFQIFEVWILVHPVDLGCEDLVLHACSKTCNRMRVMT